jgi:hypothetical protein
VSIERPAARLRQIVDRLSPTAQHAPSPAERERLLEEAHTLCHADPRLEDICARAFGTQWPGVAQD